MEPIYHELAEKLRGVTSLIVAAINVPENDIPPELPVQGAIWLYNIIYIISVGFPTILLFPVDAKDDPVPFEGERTLTDLLTFVRDWR